MVANTDDAQPLFFVALEKYSPEEWPAFLDGACGANSELRQQVERLLAAHVAMGSIHGGTPLTGVIAINRQLAEEVGTLIGPYKLLEQIGEGGMGVVYVAEQTEPVRRRVALKIIKPGMDTKQVIARFEAERQALAMMDHLNIARVLDAGTTEQGRPYFAMELVRGMPITDYCDKARLSPRQRLALFADVCHAVQHAHQKGIIHRDLKPSNVMVTTNDGRAVVKVIDFGVVKAVGPQLTERTVYTALTQLVGTPLYMSPEQAELTSNDVDTRSDVYSLGVLLYELLTGQTPFDKERMKCAGFDEMRRIIREEEPPRPSHRISTLGAQASSTLSQQRGLDERHLRRVLRGELDWIVMKALEKDRSRRYESASALAADIQRYLSDEPVLACPPTAMYRFQKFARKHKPSVATAAAIALCLILGTTVSAWQAVRATTAEAQANSNEAQAKGAAAAEAKQRERAETNEQKAIANAVTAQEKEQEAIKQRDEVKALADKLAAKDQQLERTLYAAHMNLAHNAFEAGAPGRLRELLAQHRPKPGETDLRGFEWHFLNRLCPADLLVLEHRGRVKSVAYSPDGKRLATASEGGTKDVDDGTLSVWDAQTGKMCFSQPAGVVASVTFSPDGTRVASRSIMDRTVKIRDAETGRELLSIPEAVGLGVAFTPDGKRLAAGCAKDGPLAIWDAQTGERLLTFEVRGAPVLGVTFNPNQSRSLAFSPDGNRLASAGGDKTVKLWDAEKGQMLHSLDRHSHTVYGVAYSPDGKRLASASVDKTVKLWDAESGNEIRTLLGHTSIVLGVTFSPDGKRLASASDDNTVKVWDVESGDELYVLKGHTRAVWSVAFSPDGQRLASASEDGTVKVQDVKAVQKSLVLGGGSADVSQVAFSPDGKRLSSVHQGRSITPTSTRVFEANVWDIKSGEKLLTIDAGDTDAALSQDGRRLSGAAAYMPRQAGQPRVLPGTNIWDLLTGEKLRTLPSGAQLALSPDGNRLVSLRRLSNAIRNKALDAKTRQSVERENYSDGKVWDTTTGEEISSLKSRAKKMSFSPDGKRLAGTAEDGTLKLWDAQTGDEILSFQGAASSLAFSEVRAAFSHDGKCIVGSSDDVAAAKVWNVQTGEEILLLKGHSGAITGLAFSPDNKRLATTSSDATIKVWDRETGQELLTLAGNGSRYNGVAFSHDGNRLAAGGPNGTVVIYDATPLPDKP